ncbi:MAG TPA: hypothetical protein VLZ07_08490 [Syntrophales bacterium]|nr:hypothetical protein [Syntrophales bacterium]
MNKNLDDYRREMKELQSRSDSLQGPDRRETKNPHEEKERQVTVSPSLKWAKLIPGLMAILMAILTLLFLIISEALKKN